MQSIDNSGLCIGVKLLIMVLFEIELFMNEEPRDILILSGYMDKLTEYSLCSNSLC